LPGNITERWREPLRVWLIVLGTVFTTESAVMVALPFLLPAEPSRTLEAAVDAVLLTVVLAPLLWGLLLRPLQEASRLRADFLNELFTSIEADRRQTAYDLHDGVGQSLTLLISGLRSAAPTTTAPDVARRCLELKQLAKQALTDVKRLALGLRPSLLDDFGLALALDRVAVDVRENHTLAVEIDTTAVTDRRFPGPVETAAFRIVQEALSNVVKHANATTARVAIRLDVGFLELEIGDDGIGMPVALKRGYSPGHLGLTGMRERASLLGGSLDIDSTPGRGTRVIARLPCGDVPE